MPASKDQAKQILGDVSMVVIDDNANTLKLLRELLQAFGVDDLRLAADAQTGLEMVNFKAPDMILCDWHMVPMDGIAFLKRLRHRDNAAGCRVPAIMLTAHTKPEVVKASMDAGANHFVAKPIVPANLLKRIQWVSADPRVFVLEGDHYVLREAPAAVAAATASKAEEIWEI